MLIKFIFEFYKKKIGKRMECFLFVMKPILLGNIFIISSNKKKWKSKAVIKSKQNKKKYEHNSVSKVIGNIGLIRFEQGKNNQKTKPATKCNIHTHKQRSLESKKERKKKQFVTSPICLVRFGMFLLVIGWLLSTM